MTVAELIAWLQTQPPDAEVSQLRHCVKIRRPEGHVSLEFNYRMRGDAIEYWPYSDAVP